MIFPRNAVLESLELFPCFSAHAREIANLTKSAISLKYSLRDVSTSFALRRNTSVTKNVERFLYHLSHSRSSSHFSINAIHQGSRHVSSNRARSTIKVKKYHRVLRYSLPPYGGAKKCQKTREIIRIYVFLLFFFNTSLFPHVWHSTSPSLKIYC